MSSAGTSRQARSGPPLLSISGVWVKYLSGSTGTSRLARSGPVIVPGLCGVRAWCSGLWRGFATGARWPADTVSLCDVREILSGFVGTSRCVRSDSKLVSGFAAYAGHCFDFTRASRHARKSTNCCGSLRPTGGTPRGVYDGRRVARACVSGRTGVVGKFRRLVGFPGGVRGLRAKC